MNTEAHKTYKPLVSIFFLLILSLATISSASASPPNTVIFGAQPWPGVSVKTEVASQILQKIGYKTKTIHATSTVIGISQEKDEDNQVDVTLGNWLPSERNVINPLIGSGKVQKVSVNIRDARYSLVVPPYVWNAGVHSIADLHKYGDKFDHKIYGIEAGNVGNNIMNKAIHNDTYHLGSWQVVASSTAAMLATVGRATKTKKWIVFLGWSPHWMNIKYDIKYLKDPKAIWGRKTAKVLTLANSTFIKTHPNVARFLRQFILPAKVQSEWIYDYSYKNNRKLQLLEIGSRSIGVRSRNG